ncbi:hypothetical protein F5I97DRAFT_1318327 [Phlebopus sp. FC_14]|nr:hypothetical protein F5I97DRAFT_1318327 [Phlebopus sp. FC_14]
MQRPIHSAPRRMVFTPRNVYAPEGMFDESRDDVSLKPADVQAGTVPQDDEPSDGNPITGGDDSQREEENDDIQPSSEEPEEPAVEHAPFIAVTGIEESTKSPETEAAAARVIQAIYRRRMHPVRLQTTIIPRTKVHAAFELCLKQDNLRGWKPSRYRLLYLGLLPHVLVGLDEGISITSDIKDQIKQQLRAEDYKRFEELDRRRTEITALSKQGRNLRRQLEPAATFHEKRDVGALKQAVIERSTSHTRLSSMID